MKNHAVIFISILLFFSLLHSTEITSIKKPKSSATGIVWSVGSTVIPVGVGSLVWWSGAQSENNTLMWAGGLLGVGGAIVGPDIGHFYAQKWSRGWERVGVRFTIGLALGLSTAYIVVAAGAAGVGGETNQTWDYITDGILILSGFGYCAYTIWDIATVPRSVREYNESIINKNGLHIFPRIDMTSKKYGFSLVYTF